MAKGVKGYTYCTRCQKETPYHLTAVTLYGISFGPERVCNECDYVIQPLNSSTGQQNALGNGGDAP